MRAGKKRGFKGKRLANFVFGTLTNMMKRKGKDMRGRPLKSSK